jgi:hypothetical protein
MIENKKKNEIIEKLITEFQGYIKYYKDKLKVNNLFNELNGRINSDLHTLV